MRHAATRAATRSFAAAVTFLASELSSFIIGSSLYLDGDVNQT
jgi:enoyl-[acyl-carrier-protein] reductase (NADH)